MASNQKPDQKTPKTRPPATTPEAEENEMIALAMDLAKKKLRNGTASSQLVTHFVKLGSTKERVEQELLEKKKELMVAKTESIKSAKVIEELYTNALKAMSQYQGHQGVEDDA